MGSCSSGGKGNADKYSYKIIGDAGDYQKEADRIINGVKSVLSDFGMESEFEGVQFIENPGIFGRRAKNMSASMNYVGRLNISKPYLAMDETQRQSNGYLVNDTFEGVGTHEAGHLVISTLLKQKVMPDARKPEKLDAFENAKLEKAILKEAKKRYGSNPYISGYGSKKPQEKIAEAVSDVYTNKGKANPYSRVIVSVMKDINEGKFIPKIKIDKE